MKLIVAGGRDIGFPHGDELVQKAFDGLEWGEFVTGVIHGGAKGIDSAAGRYFDGWMDVEEVRADWDLHGRAAGPIRNRVMAEKADALLAIWDGKSRGTASMIRIAKELGLIVHVVIAEKD